MALVATASVRDAGVLADDHLLLRQGALVGRTPSLDLLSDLTPSGARLRVVASDPLALVTALAKEADIETLARRDGFVLARGPDATRLAAAVGRAVVSSGVDVVEMRLDPLTLDEARAAAADTTQATFEAARARALAAFVSGAPGGSRP